MSKLRIYELAKELGVDNRVVINKATELGMQGKASHSNSLDPDEADKLRRAIIRQAIGVAPKSEVVTTRVDKVTGSSEAIVESRSGNVIRRRKAAPGGAAGSLSADEVAPQAVEVSAEPSEGAEVIEESEVFVATEAQEPVGGDPSPSLNDLGADLFKAVSAPPGEVQVEAVLAPQEEVVTEESSVVEQVVEPVVRVVEAEAPPPPVAVVTAPPPAQAAPVLKKPAIGPKVLGRIVLPVRKVIKPEVKKSAVPSAAIPVLVEEEDEFGKKTAKKRTKKREIARVDLVDYEGREGGRRGRSGSKSKRDEPQDKRLALDAAKIKPAKRVVRVSDTITVGELAKQMSLKASDLIAKLLEMGMMATINQALDQDTATILAQEFDFQVESTSFVEEDFLQEAGCDDVANLEPRAPVVTVMGHVDHGKTSLLDAIRNAAVAEKEAGGITQHIGAYRVSLPDGRWVTFIDTPGHAAFTSMRARGAQVTDIVILVVAADEGVMPQTIEAINHAKAAKVPIVVAMNKMDKPNANPDRIKQQLAEHGLNPEEWGGDTLYMPVSATKKTGIKELLESLLILSEMRELRANPHHRARGTVIEARQDKGRGSVATVLLQSGTLHVGDIFVCGPDYGRVRSMLDHTGEKLEAAGPSCPVGVTGFSNVPDAGDDFFVMESEAQAREVAQNRAEKSAAKEVRSLATGPISLEEFARRANNLTMEELNVVLKADVHGSVEAVRQALEKLSTDKVKVRVLHAAVGGVNESDLQLAVASKAIIVGFGVRGDPRAMQDAENAGIDVRFYRIIYELIDDVKKAMSGLLAPLRKEVSLGRVEVRDTFMVPKIGTIAGCFVTEGTIKRGGRVRLLRDSRVIHEGKMGSLRRFKDDVREVQSSYECGMSIEGYNDIKVGDVMEVFEIQEFAQSIE